MKSYLFCRNTPSAVAASIVTLWLVLARGALVTLTFASVAATSVLEGDGSSTNSAPGSCGLESGNCANTGWSTRKRKRQPESDSADDNHKHDDREEEIRFEPPDVEWCRRRPTWRTPQTTDSEDEPTLDVRATCQTLFGYENDREALASFRDAMLSSNFYRGRNQREPEDEASYDELPVLERPLIRTLMECTDGVLASHNTDPTKASTTTGTMKRPRISRLVRRNTDGLAVLAVVEDALNEAESEAVLALAHCARQHVPYLFERRTFDHTKEGGGNDVTYLAGFLQLLAPGVAYRVQDTARLVWEEAAWASHAPHRGKIPVDVPRDWDFDAHPVPPTNYSTAWYPDPVADCGIRTTEHLAYDRWGILGYHSDHGSDYTVLFAMSDPEDYEGGEFSLCPHSDEKEDESGRDCSDKVSVKPPRLSAIVFLSELSHGVEDIRTPGRTMFTNELWRYGHVPAMMTRPGARDFVFGDDNNRHDEDDDDVYGESPYGNDDEDDDETPILVKHEIRECHPGTHFLVYLKDSIDLYWDNPDEGVMELVDEDIRPGQASETIWTEVGHTFHVVRSSLRDAEVRPIDRSVILASITVKPNQKTYRLVGPIRSQEDCDDIAAKQKEAEMLQTDS